MPAFCLHHASPPTRTNPTRRVPKCDGLTSCRSPVARLALRNKKSPRDVRCWTGNFFFKPARTCGGDGEDEMRMPPVDEELERRLFGLERDSIRSGVSKDAMAAIWNTVSRLRGGLSRAGFKLRVISDYSDVSGLLLSSVCTGYQLRGAEKRMQLHNALEEMNGKNKTGSGLLPPEKLKGLDPEVRQYISTLEAKLQNSPQKNPVLEFISSMEPMSVLDSAMSARPELRHAIMKVVRQKMAELGFIEPEVDHFWGMYYEQPVEIPQTDFLDTLEMCMMIGYQAHVEEDKLSLERCIGSDTPQSAAASTKMHIDEGSRPGFLKKLGSILFWRKGN